MWMVDPKILCNKHLFGEHVETHMFVGTLNKGCSVRGYLEKGLLEVHSLRSRHEALAGEILRRGYHHKSPLVDFIEVSLGCVDAIKNVGELQSRCVRCRERINQLSSEVCSENEQKFKENIDQKSYS